MARVELSEEEFLNQYGDVSVRFKSYYKFTFTFTGKAQNGDVVEIGVGGGADDIYRFDVGADVEDTVANLQPYTGEVFRDGELIASFYDY